jgi:hypothetical protein
MTANQCPCCGAPMDASRPPMKQHERVKAMRKDGWSVKAIAERLGIAFNTARALNAYKPKRGTE